MLPLIAEAERRLLVIQGLERAERCAQAGNVAVAHEEFRRAVARLRGAQPPGDASAPDRAVTR